ncbi:MAG: hypothetical protein MUE82_12300 [Chloroflexi bacterium]|jgi:hypothetical protein|nr:hypothetical protein [Chloroflexota bacterium]
MLRGLFGVFLLGATALVGGLIGYQAGLSSSAAAAGATVVVTGGFPGLGFLFFLLFVGFLFFAAAGMRRRAHARGPWGHGWAGGGPRGPWSGAGATGGPAAGPEAPGGPASADDPRRQWIAEMHRRLHAEDAAVSGAAAEAGPGRTPAAAADGTVG